MNLIYYRGVVLATGILRTGIALGASRGGCDASRLDSVSVLMLEGEYMKSGMKFFAVALAAAIALGGGSLLPRL